MMSLVSVFLYNFFFIHTMHILIELGQHTKTQYFNQSIQWNITIDIIFFKITDEWCTQIIISRISRLLNQFINIINANYPITKMLNKLLIHNRFSIKH